MAKKKPIILKRKRNFSFVKSLAEKCGCSERTVYSALHWKSDNDLQQRVREMAYELNYVNRLKSPRKLQKI